MSSIIRPLLVPRAEASTSLWARRRDIPIAILAWTTLAAVLLWGAGHIARTLLLLVVAALLAYALAPGVKLLERVMPRFLAILIMYIIVLGVVSLLIYFVVSTAIQQVGTLSTFVQYWLTPKSNGQLTPLEQFLQSFGISQSQIVSTRNQIIAGIEGIASGTLPLLTGFFAFLLDVVVVAVLSIYFLIDGSRITTWFRTNMPQAAQANFLLDTIQRVVGGYIRGQVFLSVLIGVLVGGGLTVFHVPYALLLGVLAFILEFIPILGTLVSGLICTVVALTQGWLIALGVLIYFIVVHILEGDVIGPRIVGKAVGLHPIVSIAALIAGAELFGIVGALFASPLAGVLQALLIALWIHWRETRPEQFEEAKEGIADKIEASLSDTPTHISKTENS
ncbi:MAG: AI-2E family transporter [Ktedonobacteraceae bacterium]